MDFTIYSLAYAGVGFLIMCLIARNVSRGTTSPYGAMLQAIFPAMFVMCAVSDFNNSFLHIDLETMNKVVAVGITALCFITVAVLPKQFNRSES